MPFSADLDLPEEAVAKLEAATSFESGFSSDFIRDTGPWVFGATDINAGSV